MILISEKRHLQVKITNDIFSAYQTYYN